MTKSTEQFIKQLNHIQPNFKVIGEYVHSHKPIGVQCELGHIWYTRPTSLLDRKTGCPICKKVFQLNILIINERLVEYNKQYTSVVTLIDNQKYNNNKQLLFFKCSNNHLWKSTIVNMFKKSCKGCPICNKKSKKSYNDFQTQLDIININNAGGVIGVVYPSLYINTHTKILFNCDKQHIWSARPIDILRYHGCPICKTKRRSQISIKWLEEIQQKENIIVEYEYKFEKSRKRADGYCQETNTIYEFYGDYWHGNPKIYSPGIINQVNYKTMGELYQKTIEREELIKSLGYNLVVMWQFDYITP